MITEKTKYDDMTVKPAMKKWHAVHKLKLQRNGLPVDNAVHYKMGLDVTMDATEIKYNSDSQLTKHIPYLILTDGAWFTTSVR